MTPEWPAKLSAISSALGALFTGVGLGFIVFQLRAARRQLALTTFEHLYSRMQGIHEMFLGKPQLRPFFYAGTVNQEGHSCYDDVCIAAEMIADFFQQVSLELDLMPPKTAQGWTAYMLDVVQRSPALRTHLEANAQWYPSRLLDIAKRKATPADPLKPTSLPA